MAEPPDDLMMFVLLRELPGYTRKELLAEPAAVVNRWLALIQAQNEVANRNK